MSLESFAPMPSPPSPTTSDELLYALRESDVPAVRASLASDFDFHLPSDRWRYLAAGLVEACSLGVFSYVSMTLLLEDSAGSVWVALPALYLLERALRWGAGPRPETRWGGWVFTLGVGLTLLVGLGVVPEAAGAPLPWLFGFAFAADAAFGVRRMGVFTEPAVVSVPGAEPLVIAAVLRDQDGASLARLEQALAMPPSDVQGWLTAMTRSGVAWTEKGLVGSPVAYLTKDGRRWLEMWTDPRERAEVSRSASDLSLTLAWALVCAWLAAVFGPPESRTALTVLAGVTTLTMAWVLLRLFRRGQHQTGLAPQLRLGALAAISLLSWLALAFIADTVPSAYLVTFLASLSSAALMTQLLRNRRRPQAHSPAR